MKTRLQTLYKTHHNFILLALLFVGFRLLALLAYRPGGLVLDFSDFYWYRDFAQLTRQNYIPYQSIWTTYPPLFPWLMVGVWKLSALLPPWDNGNLWFSIFLGSVFLLFEVGNFILLYLMALKLYPLDKALKPAWIYMGLFVPVYTLTGWFESYPLFFFLLSLYLLLQGKPYLSAFFSGIGFMIKLIPLILLPVGAKLVPVKSSRWRLKLAPLNIDFDMPRLLLYGGIFLLTVIAIGYPFYRLNPGLIFGSLQITGARPPWESIWAILEGNYAYGVIPLDMRNLAWSPAEGPGSSLPWLWITLVFGLLYAFLYTRRINWQAPKVSIAFTALTVCLFFLYSKGYSPQWLGWLLIFSSLLLPNMRGVLYALVLSVANIIEANFFFIMFPQEHWLLNATVIIRTFLIIILAIEFSFAVWPNLLTPGVIKVRRYGLIAGLVILLIATIPALNRLNTAYFESRLAQSPYGATIVWLDEQPVKEAILLNDQIAYDWFYPYLRQSHTFYMLDDYADANATVAGKMTVLLDNISGQHQAVWFFDANPTITTPAETATFEWLNGLQPAHQADIDGGRLYLYILTDRP